MVTWSGYGIGATDGDGVFLQRFDASGVTNGAGVPGQHLHRRNCQLAAVGRRCGRQLGRGLEHARSDAPLEFDVLRPAVSPAASPPPHCRSIRAGNGVLEVAESVVREAVLDERQRRDADASTGRPRASAGQRPPGSPTSSWTRAPPTAPSPTAATSPAPTATGRGAVDGDPAGDALGRDLTESLDARRARPRKALAAARGRQLHGRAEDERLLPLRRDAAPQGRHRRLHGDDLLPGHLGDAGPDGDLRARGQGGLELLAAGVRRDADVHGRAGDEPVLQVGRGAGAARHRRRLRRRRRTARAPS